MRFNNKTLFPKVNSIFLFFLLFLFLDILTVNLCSKSLCDGVYFEIISI
jgi:hypothetical protein